MTFDRNCVKMYNVCYKYQSFLPKLVIMESILTIRPLLTTFSAHSIQPQGEEPLEDIYKMNDILRSIIGSLFYEGLGWFFWPR